MKIKPFLLTAVSLLILLLTSCSTTNKGEVLQYNNTSLDNKNRIEQFEKNDTYVPWWKQ